MRLLVGGALCLLVAYWGAFGSFASLIHRPLFIWLVTTLGLLSYPLWDKTPRRPAGIFIDAALAAVTAAACLKIIWNADEIMTSLPFASGWDLFLCFALVAVVLEVSRRAVGIVFPAIVIVGISYAYFGKHLPGVFRHRGFDESFIAETLYLGDLGLWGLLSGVASTVIAAFTLMGAVLLRAGGAEVLIAAATRAGGGSVGGGAKIAAIASGLFGMISGSSVANVATTGNFTIPMMKRLGYPKKIAAAVEAVASTGGQLAPPIMGAAAFIMAEIVGVGYPRIAAAATMPALLFYGGVLAAIHFKALRLGLSPVAQSEIPSWKEALAGKKGTVSIVLALGGLITGLMSGKSLQTAAFFGIAGAFAGYLLQNWRNSPKSHATVALNIVEDASRGMVIIGVLLASAQILVAMINMTGLGVSLSGAIVSAAAGDILLVAPVVAVVCLIIGMGIPTTAAYVLVAAVMAPALIRSGADPLTAHLYVFYYATLSVITPPMCVAIFVAAGIARERWAPVAGEALRIGAVIYAIPALFLMYPGLTFSGGASDVALAALAGCALVIAVSSLLGGVKITGRAFIDTPVYAASAILALSGTQEGVFAGAALLVAAVICRIRFFRFLRSK